MKRMLSVIAPVVLTAGVVATCFGAPASAVVQSAVWQTLPGGDGGACHTGGVSGSSTYTWCWGKQHLLNDGSPTRDMYSFRVTLSGSATHGHHIEKLWVEPRPRAGSPVQHWQGTDPFKPDQTVSSSHACVTTSQSVGGGSVPLTFGTSQQTCKNEVFGPKLYATAGHHAGVWSTDAVCSMPTSEVRKVYATVTVWVASGKVPLWDTTLHGMYVRSCNKFPRP